MRFPDFNDEWRITTLGEILSIGSGRDYKHLSRGDIPVFGTGGYMTSVDQFLMNGESVFIGRKGTIDKPFYYNGEFWTVDTLFYTHSFVNSYPRFVLYLFSNINWLEYNEASGVPSLSKTTISKIPICLPQPTEQKKIADFLSLIDERINNLSETIKELKTQKAGLLNQLFSQKLRFPDFDDDWTPFFVGDIAKLGRGRVISNKEIQIQLKPLYPVYSSQTLNNGVMGYLDTFDFEGEYITWTTDGANAGTVFYRSGKFNCTNVCGILKLKSEFSHLFCALGLQKETKKFVSTNLANPKLMNNTMAKISLSIPSLAEQKRIADFLSLIDERIEVEEQLLQQYEKQKRYLLRQMFV